MSIPIFLNHLTLPMQWQAQLLWWNWYSWDHCGCNATALNGWGRPKEWNKIGNNPQDRIATIRYKLFIKHKTPRGKGQGYRSPAKRAWRHDEWPKWCVIGLKNTTRMQDQEFQHLVSLIVPYHWTAKKTGTIQHKHSIKHKLSWVRKVWKPHRQSKYHANRMAYSPNGSAISYLERYLSHFGELDQSQIYKPLEDVAGQTVDATMSLLSPPTTIISDQLEGVCLTSDIAIMNANAMALGKSSPGFLLMCCPFSDWMFRCYSHSLWTVCDWDILSNYQQ